METFKIFKLLLVGILGIVISLSYISCNSKTKKEAQGEIVVCSYGGALQQAQRKAYFETFEKETGIKVKEASYSGEYGKIKAMVESQHVIWDVVDVETPVVLRGTQEDMFEPIDYDVVNKEQLIPEAVHPYAVGTDFYSTVIAYNTRRFPKGAPHPTTWAEFWDVEKFPGSRSLRNNPRGTLEFALLADGVSVEDLYPLDVDRAFRSLDKIKKYIKVWWSAGHQPAQLLADDEVVLASAWNGRIWSAAQDGAPVAVEWGEGMLDPEWWVVPKGSKNKELSMKFIAFASETKYQAILPNYISYGPTNKEAIKQISNHVSCNLPTYPENRAKQFLINGDWWAENEADVVEKWNSWLLK